MIRLNCFFKANAGHYNEALEAALLLSAESQKHAGCIAYDVFESATRKDVFMICETWEDQTSLDNHSKTAEFALYVGRMEKCGALKLEQFHMK